MQLIIALLTQSLLEIVLGLDNIIFISIVSARLPVNQQKKGTTAWTFVGNVNAYLLLTVISFILKLKPCSLFPLERLPQYKILARIDKGNASVVRVRNPIPANTAWHIFQEISYNGKGKTVFSKSFVIGRSFVGNDKGVLIVLMYLLVIIGCLIICELLK